MKTDQDNDSFSDLKERKDTDNVLPAIIVNNSSSNSLTNIPPRKFIADDVPISNFKVDRGADNDLLSIPDLYDEFTFKTDKVSSCRNLSITNVVTIADDSKDSVNKECEDSNDQISTNDRQVLSNVNKNHNHSKRQIKRTEIACKDNVTIKVTGDSSIIHKLEYIDFRLLFESEIKLFLNEVWGRSAVDEELTRNPHYPPHLRW